ncbi:MAG: VCBS repeat-containing protein, partial [Phycisphaerae bacterium]|nr:VCBS repeat-containing protein [Phycisphaerae bacterium]
MGDSLSSIHHDWPRLILLWASAMGVLLCSAALARAGAFDDQTASLFPAPPAMTLAGYAANWGDYNNDGYVDLNVYGRLWKNNGGTSFTFAHWLGSGPWGDYNNDGLLDSYGYTSNTLYRNQSSGSTTSFDQPITMPSLPMAVSRGASWADYNGNGYVDLYVGGYESPGYQADAILRNNQGVSFTKTWQH